MIPQLIEPWFTEADNLNPGRAAYRTARRLIRENGRSAFNWLPSYLGGLMRELHSARRDPLEERAEILERFKDCTPRPTPRQTGDLEQYKRLIASCTK